MIVAYFVLIGVWLAIASPTFVRLVYRALMKMGHEPAFVPRAQWTAVADALIDSYTENMRLRNENVRLRRPAPAPAAVPRIRKQDAVGFSTFVIAHRNTAQRGMPCQ